MRSLHVPSPMPCHSRVLQRGVLPLASSVHCSTRSQAGPWGTRLSDGRQAQGGDLCLAKAIPDSRSMKMFAPVHSRSCAPISPQPASAVVGAWRDVTGRAAARRHATRVGAGVGAGGEPASVYREPSEAVARIVDAPSTPVLSFSPCRTKVLQLHRPPSNPPIAEFAKPELKLAGVRIDPEVRAPSKMSYYTAISISPLESSMPLNPESEKPVTGIPEGMGINYVSWAPDGRHVAFALREKSGEGRAAPLQLWVADTDTGEAKKLLDTPVYYMSSVFATYAWLDADVLLVSVVPSTLGSLESPPPPAVPQGPYVQEHATSEAQQMRTYADLLKSEDDCERFEFYASSDIVSVKISTGEVGNFSQEPRIYTRMSPSPDGRFVIVSYIERPFSFAAPCGRFPKRIELRTREGALLREVEHLPLAEDIPIAFNACRRGKRQLGWRDDKPCTLTWAEAQDGGDPSVEASPRDVVFAVDAGDYAVGAEPTQVLATDLRFGGIAWGNDSLAMAYESWYKTRRQVSWQLSPDAGNKAIVYDRNYEDVYGDPGSPVMRRTSEGEYVLATFEDNTCLLMQGEGASPEGNRPFVDLFNLKTKETKRLWQSQAPFHETTGSLVCDGDGKEVTLQNLSMLMSRESQEDPPQYYVLSWPNGLDEAPLERQLTAFPHPYPHMKGLTKQVLRYKREDGVDLTATLYLPPGYSQERDGPLPCLLWAYPREFKSKAAAGQVRRSPNTFAYIGGTSPLLWLAKGYAVLDGPTMPIIGEGDNEPNNTFIQQLTQSARAAVDKVVSMGVADRRAVAVGGHSYGAFMTANLLAHAPDLFCCGVARSGAYNRTLTPFGFQSEERTIWQAQDTYVSMSPYLFADKITKPLLLIHGDEDNNAGTSKMQSERLFAALKGHGSVCKLVLLPHESHGYRARESVMHCLYETEQWLEKHCRGKLAASTEELEVQSRL